MKGPGRPQEGLSDELTELRFLSLLSYDNYTTAHKCNRADWEIHEWTRVKPHMCDELTEPAAHMAPAPLLEAQPLQNRGTVPHQ